MRSTLLAIIISFYTFSSLGQVGGQTAFDFLRIADNARIAALGGENITTKDRDPNLFSYNPAAINHSMYNRFSINYMPFYSDVWKAGFTYVTPIKNTGTWAFNFQYLDYGTLIYADASGNQAGEFGAGDWALSVGKSFSQNNITIGVNWKLAGSAIATYSALATMLDVGGMWEHPKRDFKVGMMIKNIGIVLSDYSPTSQSNLPFDVQLGWSYKLEHMPLRFSMTAHHLNKFDIVYLDPLRQTTFDEDGNEVPKEKTNFDKFARHLVFGGEFIFSQNFHARFGYNVLRRRELRLEETSGGAGFSFGLMMRIKTIELNFTRAYYHVVGGTTMLTLTTDVKRLLRKKISAN